MAPPFAYSGGCTGATTASQGRLDLVPKKKSDPSLQPASAFLDALQDRGRGLKDRYRGKPLELAKRLGLKLPEKPVQKMIRLGVLTKEEAEEKYGPIRPGLREWIEDVCNKDVELAAVVASRGGGKALALTTPLPTPDGWTTMGQVRAGDTLYGSDGRPCTVTKVYPVQKNRPCYEMFFSDQSFITCDAEHLWVTSNYKERNSGDSQVRTTQDVVDTLTYGSREDSNHSITSCSPVRFPKRDLPIDPYLLGVWLGDGDSIQGYLTIATRDQDIVRRLERRGHVLVEVPSHRRETSRTWRVIGLTTRLRSMNLIKNKHVPDIYLRASVRQRRWLLAGLMDTDGTVPQGKGTCTFDSMDVSLADAVEELVVSLGWKATRTTKRAMLYGKDCGESQRVWFRPTQNVFRTSFKRDRLANSDGNSQQRRHSHRMIKDVVRVKSEPVRCIEVDSPDHTYLCGYQMVPTHNSQGVSFIEFFLVVVEDFDALNLGGSEFQAEQVYSYLVVYFESDPYWKTLIKSGEPMRERTDMKDGNWIQVLAASPKSTRSRHAGGGGGKVRGGILVIDEEAEAEPGIVNSALPTVNTASPSITVRSSTFHKAVGSFQELIDNHVSMGYKLYFWDIIDVAQRCDCIGSCQNPEPCFREDHVEEYIDPEETDPAKQVKKRLVHRAYCGGRAMYADGWISMKEIVKLWMSMNRNHSQWEVEAMGSRPSTSGYVIKDHTKLAENVTEKSGMDLYIPGGGFITVCVDWGTVAAGIEVWQEQFDIDRGGEKHVLIACEQIEQAGLVEISSSVMGYVMQFVDDFQEVAADIGGGGNYLNPHLRSTYGIEVRDVNFNQEKESGIAAFNILSENNRVVIPQQFELMISQLRRWRRNNGGQVMKGNDHLCDAMVCNFSKFVDRMGIAVYRVLPQTFNAGGAFSTNDQRPNQGFTADNRVPIAFGFGSSS